MITTIPELNEFLAAKTKRLEEEDRVRLAAARKLEQETAAVATAPRTGLDLLCDVIEAARTVRRPPTIYTMIVTLAESFDATQAEVLEWLRAADFQGYEY